MIHLTDVALILHVGWWIAFHDYIARNVDFKKWTIRDFVINHVALTAARAGVLSGADCFLEGL